MEKINIKRVLFLGEQSGTAESELKDGFRHCFASDNRIELAYLVRVSYANTPIPQIALCLKGNKDAISSLECAGKFFTTTFGAKEHLDMFFLSEAQLIHIARVAKPFYSREKVGH